MEIFPSDEVVIIQTVRVDYQFIQNSTTTPRMFSVFNYSSEAFGLRSAKAILEALKFQFLTQTNSSWWFQPNMSQIGSFPQVGVNKKKCLKPPRTSIEFNKKSSLPKKLIILEGPTEDSSFNPYYRNTASNNQTTYDKISRISSVKLSHLAVLDPEKRA